MINKQIKIKSDSKFNDENNINIYEDDNKSEYTYNQSSSIFEMRAQPRRRKDVDEQPLFLRKAFNMITSCPADMGGWTDRGESFIIKDPKVFAEKIIPTYYKHNNFSSFVRQLNFYGFRKVKSDNLLNPLWWEIRHPQFLRGEPQLLSEIKRAIHYNGEGSNVHEVTDLKNQVNQLRNQVVDMNESINELSSMVSNIVLNDDSSSNMKKSNKKRRHGAREFLPTGPELTNTSIFRSDSEEMMLANDDEWDDNTLERLFSFDLSTTDNESNDIVIKSEYNKSDEILVTAVPVSDQQSVKYMSAEPFTNPSTSDLSQILGLLTPEMQARFVDKLAETVGSQLAAMIASNKPVHTTAVIEREVINTPVSVPQMNNSQSITKTSVETPAIALPLASAALGAFVASLTQNQNRIQHSHSNSLHVAPSLMRSMSREIATKSG
eukprot:CAMPEP_0196762684 /NCGR_PEP_ID=MMETSP1095-20130614/2552_1 /TAXON_ID=96789 ORGANISM="Chromulina nebulosa, Strain UTEXLB2642" /NCGR_SAMPLE_ID=MMETSP1095 /ASSEMBLY_ACC=CAM_ASM_000446 /LENGTH=435 /DNA_ID=CAMNT_0042114227 /DNA_START=1312 /DNA_END=2619 /DNA_ORIENTATION=+